MFEKNIYIDAGWDVSSMIAVVKKDHSESVWVLVRKNEPPSFAAFLIDENGFGVSEAFGGPITTPTMDNLAANGLKFNRFHTTSLCSPTRVALLTGYNHHSNNMGCIGEAATTYPGNTSVRPQTITPMAEVLRQNGYNTAAF